MAFNSLAFAMLFLLVYALRRTVGKRSNAPGFLAVLLVANLVFYSWHVPSYLLILLTSTVIDYTAGRLLVTTRGARKRRLLLLVSLATNLGILGVFKYSNFFVGEVELLATKLGLDVVVGRLDLILPMGISFYTFQSMSYTIDVYRGLLKPTRSFWRFLLFVSFFPQLVAGPIVRARAFMYQLDRARGLSWPVALEGAWLVSRGFFLKLVVADNLGPVVDHWWTASTLPGADPGIARAVVVLFSFQIFADFAGYSSIARGLAYLLGYRLPVNFRAPYIATSFREFWTRWHITLSEWFRDYLYIPLGGSRRGPARTMLNLMLTFLASGLWHGAARTFLIWGALHGLALVIERALGAHEFRRPGARLAWFLTVQLTVLLTWVFFRAADPAEALGLLSAGLRLQPGTYPDFPLLACGVLVAIPLCLHVVTALRERKWLPPASHWERAGLAAAMTYGVITAHGVSDAFIYFQF